MFVARYSLNIKADIKRGWSGYFEPAYETLDDAARLGYWPTEWDEEEDAADWLEANDIDFRHDPENGGWRHVHHNGLSCWVLDAERENAALFEAATKDNGGEIGWHGFGYATRGKVRLVASWGILHILEVDYVTMEI